MTLFLEAVKKREYGSSVSAVILSVVPLVLLLQRLRFNQRRSSYYAIVVVDVDIVLIRELYVKLTPLLVSYHRSCGLMQSDDDVHTMLSDGLKRRSTLNCGRLVATVVENASICRYCRLLRVGWLVGLMVLCCVTR